jgi:type I restriction enzyme, R subunit
MLAVVEAKAAYKLPGDGLQQAKEYAEVLGLRFAYSTNGHGIIEFDYTTGHERELKAFPTPDELWQRLRSAGKIEDEETANKLLTPANAAIGKGQRYYQEIAINRVIQAILQGISGCFSPWPLVPGKPLLPFRSAGSSGVCAGMGRENTAGPRFFTSLIGTS